MNKKNKEARQKCYVCAGIDELNQIVAENWQLWKMALLESLSYRFNYRKETHRMNEKNKEARQKVYAHGGIDERNKIFSKKLENVEKNASTGITELSILNKSQKHNSFHLESVDERIQVSNLIYVYIFCFSATQCTL